ncbi:MAG: hypothetical protein A2787_01820 [Omnitrophica WOR_2 bacterium RIFCSPHIGHO2_01_FULL_48_9]|nr:MAG: hypothetical protein A3D10_08355 [Omnitrophica WOR_2 bacterium RIFCSPHIGHO2_02_FULL_48_11]OGX31221.1 MAG: hypothetical protein A2787_01820 [Omnitrophica WOR_2 bacterium RIFCSPHIGHO2_01_FULL_48_9]
MQIFVEFLGWAGTLLILWAYYLVSYKKIDPDSVNYQLMNLIGSVGIGVNVFWKQSWPAVTLEVVWGLIAFWALVRTLKQQ